MNLTESINHYTNAASLLDVEIVANNHYSSVAGELAAAPFPADPLCWSALTILMALILRFVNG